MQVLIIMNFVKKSSWPMVIECLEVIKCFAINITVHHHNLYRQQRIDITKK